MEKQIVRFEHEMWWIRADVGEISSSEREKLEVYFAEIKLPCRLADGRLCVAGGIDRDTVFERLEQFYGGWADVLPFRSHSTISKRGVVRSAKCSSKPAESD